VIDNGPKPDLTGHTFECRWGPPATCGVPQMVQDRKSGATTMTGVMNITLPVIVNPDFWCWRFEEGEKSEN
jgi:hypothetical protein